MKFNLKWNYTGMNTLAERIRFFGQCDEVPALVMLDIIARLQAAVESLTAEKEALAMRPPKKHILVCETHKTAGELLDDTCYVCKSELLESSLAQAREEIDNTNERLRLEKSLSEAAYELVSEFDEYGSGDVAACIRELLKVKDEWKESREQWKLRAEAAVQREKGLRAALADMFDPLQHRVACQKRLMDKCMCAACITERAKAALAAASKEGVCSCGPLQNCGKCTPLRASKEGKGDGD